MAGKNVRVAVAVKDGTGVRVGVRLAVAVLVTVGEAITFGVLLGVRVGDVTIYVEVGGTLVTDNSPVTDE